MKLLFGAIALIFFALESCSFSQRKSLAFLKASEGKTYDAIIVPGYPFTEPAWHDVMRARVYWAKWLFDRGFAKNLIFSGSSVYSPYIEGKIMGLYAKAIGIPESSIFVEAFAEHSTENLFYAVKLGKKTGFKSFALASDPFQCKMLKGFARRHWDGELALLPFVFDSLENYPERIYTPSIPFHEAKVEPFISLTEREGFFKRLKGTRGKSINPNHYE